MGDARESQTRVEGVTSDESLEWPQMSQEALDSPLPSGSLDLPPESIPEASGGLPDLPEVDNRPTGVEGELDNHSPDSTPQGKWENQQESTPSELDATSIQEEDEGNQEGLLKDLIKAVEGLKDKPSYGGPFQPRPPQAVETIHAGRWSPPASLLNTLG